MKAKLFYVVMALVMVLSLVAVATPAMPVSASPCETLTVSFVTTITDPGNARALSMNSGDEVVQFTRANVVIPAGGASGYFHTVVKAAGAISGDLTGTLSMEWNSIDLPGGPQTIIPDADGFGFTVGTGVVDCGGGNTFKSILAADYDYTVIEAGVIHSEGTGYMVSVEEDGDFSGQNLIGTFSYETYDDDEEPGEEMVTGTMTFTRYFSYEISGPHPVSITGTTIDGNPRGLTFLSGDDIVQFTRPDIVLASGMPGFLVEGTHTTASTTGYLTGSLGIDMNFLSLYPGDPPTPLSGEGWSVGKFNYSDADGTIDGIFLFDAIGFEADGVTFDSEGYMLALASGSTGKYAGAEYFGIYSGTSARNEVSADIDLYVKRCIPVGGEVYPVNKLAILAPWIGLAVLLIAGIGWLTLRRRRAQS